MLIGYRDSAPAVAIAGAVHFALSESLRQRQYLSFTTPAILGSIADFFFVDSHSLRRAMAVIEHNG